MNEILGSNNPKTTSVLNEYLKSGDKEATLNQQYSTVARYVGTVTQMSMHMHVYVEYARKIDSKSENITIVVLITLRILKKLSECLCISKFIHCTKLLSFIFKKSHISENTRFPN